MPRTPTPAHETAATAAAPLDQPRLPEPPDPAPDLRTLRHIRDDAAARASALLAGQHPTDPDPVIDMLRLLSRGEVWQPSTESLERARLTAAQLRRLRVAYTKGRAAGGEHGGAAFVHTTLHPSEADPDVIKQAAAAIAKHPRAARATVHTDANQITIPETGTQIRLGPDQRWHPYTRTNDDWAPASGSHPDPIKSFTAALDARSSRT